MHRNSFSTWRAYELGESCALFGNAHFDILKKTVLYIPGYLEGPKHESVNVIVNAYLQRNDHNVLVLDWSELAKGNYLIEAVPNAKQVFYHFFHIIIHKKIQHHSCLRDRFRLFCIFSNTQLATKISEVILDWVDEGLEVNRFHVIGHTLGGQIAALIGRYAFKKCDGEIKLTRITALDPPAIFPLGARINENDAEFVDIIFTDAWFYSTPKSYGTVNFWPTCPKFKSKASSDNGEENDWQKNFVS